MSARLRDAVRSLLHDIEGHVSINAGSPFASLRDALAAEDARLLDIEPDVVSERDARIARLVGVLAAFSKPGGHYVGCPGDKGGLCSATCRTAQLACDQRVRGAAVDTISRLQAEATAWKREWRHLRARLNNQKLIHRRVLLQIQAETGFVMRSPGRPKKGTGPATAKDAGRPATTATKEHHVQPLEDPEHVRDA